MYTHTSVEQKQQFNYSVMKIEFNDQNKEIHEKKQNISQNWYGSSVKLLVVCCSRQAIIIVQDVLFGRMKINLFVEVSQNDGLRAVNIRICAYIL